MRTTIDIDDAVMRKLKRVAADAGMSLRAVVEDALRSELSRRSFHAEASEKQQVITFRGKGTLRSVDLDNNADLLDLMEGQE